MNGNGACSCSAPSSSSLQVAHNFKELKNSTNEISAAHGSHSSCDQSFTHLLRLQGVEEEIRLFLGGGVAKGESDSAQVSEIISAEDLDSTSEEVESTIISSSNFGLHRRSQKLATMMSVDENSSLLSAAAPESDKVQKVSEPKVTPHSRMKHTQPTSTPSHFQIRESPLSSNAIFNQASAKFLFLLLLAFLVCSLSSISISLGA
jgi:hypothetical protein